MGAGNELVELYNGLSVLYFLADDILTVDTSELHRSFVRFDQRTIRF
jgi:hypothetical protein